MVSFPKRNQLERLHRAASRAITSCLSSSPISLLLSEASLPPLRITLSHFTLLSYERALGLPTSFPISGLARLGVKQDSENRPEEFLCPLTHSCFLLLPQWRFSLLALPFLVGICFHGGVHFFLSMLPLSLSPRCGSRPS